MDDTDCSGQRTGKNEGQPSSTAAIPAQERGNMEGCHWQTLASNQEGTGRQHYFWAERGKVPCKKNAVAITAVLSVYAGVLKRCKQGKVFAGQHLHLPCFSVTLPMGR